MSGDEIPDAAQLTRMLPAVAASLAEMGERGVPARAAGAAALAVRYAELLDDAVVAKKYSNAIRVITKFVNWKAGDLPSDMARQVESSWDTIMSALAEHTTASDLGPKLLAALDRLELTPASTPAPVKVPVEPIGQGTVPQLTNPLIAGRERSVGRYALQPDA